MTVPSVKDAETTLTQSAAKLDALRSELQRRRGESAGVVAKLKDVEAQLARIAAKSTVTSADLVEEANLQRRRGDLEASRETADELVADGEAALREAEAAAKRAAEVLATARVAEHLTALIERAAAIDVELSASLETLRRLKSQAPGVPDLVLERLLTTDRPSMPSLVRVGETLKLLREFRDHRLPKSA